MTRLRPSGRGVATGDDRVDAVAKFGFTERQARFLVTVMLHSGVCLQRQYAAFAGIRHGQKTRKFFAKLVKLGFAVEYACRHNRGHLYHVRAKPLYRAIDQTDSRHRRPLSAACVVENLGFLDALLSSPSVVWLGTSNDVRVHLSSLAGVSPEQLDPFLTDDLRSTRAIRGRMATGIDLSGRWVFLYVPTDTRIEGFHTFVQRHAAVLARLPSWTVRVVFQPPLGNTDRYVGTFKLAIASVRPEVLKDLQSYFKQRRAHTLERAEIYDEEGYYTAREAFRAPRFQVLYQRWSAQGDGVFEPISTDAISDAFSRGAGRIETHVLPFSYRHLSPVVDMPQHPSKGAEEGHITPARPRPPLTESITGVESGASSLHNARV